MTLPPQTPDELDRLTQRTLAYYNENVDDFFASTRGHDVRQNINTLQQFIEGPAPHHILDFGCGLPCLTGSLLLATCVVATLEPDTGLAAQARPHNVTSAWYKTALFRPVALAW